MIVLNPLCSPDPEKSRFLCELGLGFKVLVGSIFGGR